MYNVMYPFSREQSVHWITLPCCTLSISVFYFSEWNIFRPRFFFAPKRFRKISDKIALKIIFFFAPYSRSQQNWNESPPYQYWRVQQNWRANPPMVFFEILNFGDMDLRAPEELAARMTLFEKHCLLSLEPKNIFELLHMKKLCPNSEIFSEKNHGRGQRPILLHSTVPQIRIHRSKLNKKNMKKSKIKNQRNFQHYIFYEVYLYYIIF